MIDIDFEVIEDELDIVIPDIYRMFIDAINSEDLELKKYGIYHDTDSILKGNFKLRELLSDSKPKWENEFFDFGVGDGCGNYFFMIANDEEDNEVKLWAHDPEGIENVSSASEFLTKLLSEIRADFKGEYQYYYQGNGDWS